MLDFEISPGDAEALLRENRARFIDVREPWEFAAAKIDRSVLMPMGDVLRAPLTSSIPTSGWWCCATTASGR